jgi:hypothetical protein
MASVIVRHNESSAIVYLPAHTCYEALDTSNIFWARPTTICLRGYKSWFRRGGGGARASNGSNGFWCAGEPLAVLVATTTSNGCPCIQRRVLVCVTFGAYFWLVTKIKY